MCFVSSAAKAGWKAEGMWVVIHRTSAGSMFVLAAE